MADVVVNCSKWSSLIFVIFAVLFLSSEGFDTLPGREVIARWADHLNSRLIQELDKYTGIKNLEKTYDDLRKAKLVELDGLQLVQNMARDLTKNLEKKMAALERLVQAAEEEVRNYKYDSTLRVSDISFKKMDVFEPNDPNLVYSEKFKRGVNYSYSGVHIPVGIFEGYPEIINGLKWSAALDNQFRENLKNDPDLMWQYFGSTTGFMRTYPAHKWVVLSRKPGFPDLYDVRLRPWYVHASSSPKDMLILMDTSGSMHGQTMEIMKIAVKTLLTTLGENDFVNVASFNNEAQWIACFDTFVQANRRNKLRLSQAIDKLDDRNMASLSKGLEFAFKEFEKFRENRTESWAGAECNEVIMLFSDGGTEEAWEVLKKYNAEKKVRIFAYVVGPHPVPYAALKEIACTNRGFFIGIPAMGSIRANIQDYVKVLARPIVLSGEKHFRWTNFYLDPVGLGMITTITLPVFNRTGDGNQSMAGIMGIDIPLKEMLDSEPSFEIGPASYSFGMDKNGFMAFHPKLQTEFKFTDDPPHTDFLEVEIRNKHKEELRRAMINGETGRKSIPSLLKMPDNSHIVRHHMEYFYTPLNKTTFSIAIVMPIDRTHNLEVTGMDFEEGVGIDLDEVDGTYFAPWKYCHSTVLNMNSSEIVRNLSVTLRTTPEKCKRKLMQRLLWDVRKTEDIVHYWETEDRDEKREGVIATFVQSEGGLTRIFPPREAHRFQYQLDPAKSEISQRAFYAGDYVFLPPVSPFDLSVNDSNTGSTTIVKSITFSRTGVTYRPAVVGVVIDPSWLQQFILTTPAAPGKAPITCADDDNIVCYLLDDAGFIITTNQEDHWDVIGQFLGYTDSEMMQELFKKKIYTRHEEYNYDERCKKKEREVSAGYRIPPVPFYSLFSSFGWLFDIAAWSQLRYWLYSFLSSGAIPSVDALPEFFELPNETICNKREAQYYLDRWGSSFDGELQCNNCTRNYSLAKVGPTNLILVVSTKPCSPIFCDPVPPLLQKPEEDPSPVPCSPPLRYRVRPDHCYSYHPDEDNSECGIAVTLPRPHVALFFELICLVSVAAFFKSYESGLTTC